MNDFDIKEAFDRELDRLAPMPDAIPGVVLAGRRSLRRRRAVAGLGGVVASVAVAAVALIANQAGQQAPVAGQLIGPPQPSIVTPTPTPTPTPTSAAKTKYTGPPDWFRKHIAQELSAVLPAQFGTVTAVIPEREASNGYRVTAGGRTFSITFNLTKPRPGEPSTTCEQSGPRRVVIGGPKPLPPVSCTARALPNGGRAMANHYPDTGTTLSTVTLTALVENRSAAVYVFATKSAEPPITDKEMLDVAANPRFAGLIRAWASHPAWVVDENAQGPRQIVSAPPPSTGKTPTTGGFQTPTPGGFQTPTTR